MEEWKAARAAAARPGDDEPQPPRRPKEKDKTGSGQFRFAAGNIALRVRKSARELTGKMAERFSAAKAAMTAPECPDWLREFFETSPAPNNLFDPSNPDRNSVLGTSDSAVFDAGYYDISGPSLDL